MSFTYKFEILRHTPARLSRIAVLSMCFAGLCLSLVSSVAIGGERLTLNFNPDWKFIKADPAGAAGPGFDDSQWTTVSTPHTYNDIDTFDDWSLPGHRGEQNQWGGRTWYRKTFSLPESFKDKQVYIEFEGVRQVAEVYLNGQLLGVSKTGFIPFGFDLTAHLRFDKPNVLAVMCDNRFMKDPLPKESGTAAGTATAPKDQKKAGSDLNIAPPASPSLAQLSAQVNAAIPEEVDQIQADQIPWNNPHWHPAHGGIYRNVYLHVVDPLHISLPLYSFLETAGPYVYTSDVSEKSAQVNLEVPIGNGRKTAENVELRADVLDRDGKPVLTLKHSEQIGAGKSAEFKVSGAIQNPQLWEPDYPYLYRVVCSLLVGGKVVDAQEIFLGIRAVRWDAETGFYINGHHLKLHGWGQKPTDEWPGLGAAQPDWLHFYTLDLMKQAGGNFVRWGHCAGGPALIAAGDRLGIITEQPGLDGESDTRGAAWKIRAAGFRDMIVYYRNNPSILIWEGGNQKVTREHAKELRGYMDKYDPHGGRVYAHRRADKITAEFMDVCIGTEGGREIMELPVVEGEYDREESPRRVWDDFSPPNFGYPEAKGQEYQLTSEQYAANQVAQFVRKVGAANHCGGANWIFSDSTSGGRVAVEVARASGEVDGVRLPKEAYYVCRAMFHSDPQVHIIGHWNYPAGTKKTIYVASNCDEAELFVNGKSLGRGKVSDRYLFAFPDVAWEPGEIKAVAYANGKSAATQTKRTVGPAVGLRLTPITGPGGLRADGSDVALIDVEAVDASGRQCPTFQKRVDFQIEGPGIWRGGYNSGKIHSINNTFLDLECGINRVAVRAGREAGKIVVTAMCEELKPGSVVIESVPIKIDNGTTTELPAMRAVDLQKMRVGEVAASAAAPQARSRQLSGRFITSFSYSGPAANVHLQQDAGDDKKIYIDSDLRFARLPEELKGGDYVQAACADRFYSAVDLMEIAVKPGTIVWVAYDAGLPPPSWLTRQFESTNLTLAIDSRPMKIFRHRADNEESLTLGSNAENTDMKSCNMYVVFASAGKERTAPAGKEVKPASAGGAEIRTPKPPAMPRINGPAIFGVRPGSPFLYRIPATGQRPVQFSVDALPVGLQVDSATGQITGSLIQPGEHVVTLRAKNDLGAAEKKFKIAVGESIALTPPMGWNSWNCWGSKVTAEKVLQSARGMVSSGLIDHGWTYINIDDAWQGDVRGGPFHAIQGNEKFPDMKGLCDEIHKMGLKAGIYSTPWVTSYASHMGSSAENPQGTWEKPTIPKKGNLNKKILPWAIGKYSFAENDAKQWAAWGIDYLKYDWNPNELPETAEMYKALRASGRDVVLSLSNSTPFKNIAELSKIANCWRITGDIRDNWDSMSKKGFGQDKWEPYSAPGHWNDPDMLVVGRVGWGAPHPTNLTPDEQYTHISIWCLVSAPLLLGCDLANLDDFTINLLTNDEVLAVNQDSLGKQATLVSKHDALQVYAKDLADGSKAVGLFNLGDMPAMVAVKWPELKISGPQAVRDLWRQKDLGQFNDQFQIAVAPHGAELFKINGL